MQIILTKEESLEYFHTALCNAVGTGYIANHGLQMDYSEDEYRLAKDKIADNVYEDILIQILKDSGSLTLQDVEGEDAHTKSITIDDVYEKVQLTPPEHLLNMITENDDAETADVLLQTVFYGEIIFG
jgi:hypothetical protein